MSYEKQRLADISTMRTGKLNSNAAVAGGAYPFFTCAQETYWIDKPAFNTEAVILGGNNANGVYPLKYYNGEFNAYQRTYIFETLDAKKLNIRYLYYALRPALLQFQAASIGAATQYLTKSILDNFKVSLPDIDQQNNIVSTLSNYDDLIENNKRRIELLEDSARQLYKEWFVRFRFPGHEHVKTINGVPEGWQRGSVGDIALVFSGYAFKSKDWLEEGNPVIKIKNITEQNTVDISECQCVDDNVAEKAVKFKLLAGDMLIAMTGATVGKVGLLPSSDRTFYLNQRVGKFVSKIERNAISLLLPFFNSEKAQASIDNLAGGAAQPNISAKQIESIELPIPPKSILDIYLDEVDAWFELRSNLVDQNLRLAQARDLLLPKVMSGEIAV